MSLSFTNQKTEGGDDNAQSRHAARTSMRTDVRPRDSEPSKSTRQLRPPAQGWPGPFVASDQLRWCSDVLSCQGAMSPGYPAAYPGYPGQYPAYPGAGYPQM